MTWYVVYKGRVPGVYDDWEDCRRQVHRFSGNSYKGYNTMEEAEARYTRYLAGVRSGSYDKEPDEDLHLRRGGDHAYLLWLFIPRLCLAS